MNIQIEFFLLQEEFGLKKRVIELFNLAFADGNKEKYNNFEKDFNVKLIELKDGEEYIGDDFKLKAYELVHGQCKPILGFILEKDNKKVGYATDTVLCENLQKMCKEANVICIDSTNTVPTKMHIGLDEVVWLKDQYKDTRFLAIHRSDYVHNHIKDIEFPEDGEFIDV